MSTNKFITPEALIEKLSITRELLEEWLSVGAIPNNCYVKVGDIIRFDESKTLNELLRYDHDKQKKLADLNDDQLARFRVLALRLAKAADDSVDLLQKISDGLFDSEVGRGVFSSLMDELEVLEDFGGDDEASKVSEEVRKIRKVLLGKEKVMESIEKALFDSYLVHFDPTERWFRAQVEAAFSYEESSGQLRLMTEDPADAEYVGIIDDNSIFREDSEEPFYEE